MALVTLKCGPYREGPLVVLAFLTWLSPCRHTCLVLEDYDEDDYDQDCDEDDVNANSDEKGADGSEIDKYEAEEEEEEKEGTPGIIIMIVNMSPCW